MGVAKKAGRSGNFFTNPRDRDSALSRCAVNGIKYYLRAFAMQEVGVDVKPSESSVWGPQVPATE